MSEEPVAGYMGSYGNKHVIGLTGEGELSVGDMLYLHPPKRKVKIQLTTDEIEKIWRTSFDCFQFARTVEKEVLRRNK